MVYRFLLHRQGIDVNAGEALEGVSGYLSLDGEDQSHFNMLLAHCRFSLYKVPHLTLIKSVGKLVNQQRWSDARALISRPDFYIRDTIYEENMVGEAWRFIRSIDYMGTDQLWIQSLVSLLVVLEKTFPKKSGVLPLATLFSFLYYAHAGFYMHPLCNRDKEDDETDDNIDMDVDWPSDEVLAALKAEGCIPPSLAPPPRNGFYDRSVYGVNFWDEPSKCEESQNILRNIMQQEGISFATTDSQGRGFIHAASAQPSHMWATALLFLLRTGADPDLRDKDGKTPLHYAAACGNNKAIDLLLAAGANPCAVDANGWTVLHSAAEGSTADTLSRLMDLSANILALGAKNESPLHIAVEHSSDPRAVIRLLVDKGCRLDARDNSGFTPGYLSLMGPIESLKTCLELGQDPFTYDGSNGGRQDCGETMLASAACQLLPQDTALCLSHLPPAKATELLNKAGWMGMSVLDYLAQFDRSVSEAIGVKEEHWAVHVPTPAATRRIYLLYFFWHRVIKMLGSDEGTRREMLLRSAHQLLLLGEDHDACIMLEQHLVPESRVMEVPFVRGVECSSCCGKDAPLFKCRVCALVVFCTACRDGDAEARKGCYDAKQCRGHGFVEFPRRQWRRMEDGKVNSRGQTFSEFLAERKDECERIFQAMRNA